MEQNCTTSSDVSFSAVTDIIFIGKYVTKRRGINNIYKDFH
jgi:hypothetical protein